MSFKICWPLKYPKIAWPTYHLENKVQKWSGTWFDKWGLFAIVAGYLNPFSNKNLQSFILTLETERKSWNVHQRVSISKAFAVKNGILYWSTCVFSFYSAKDESWSKSTKKGPETRAFFASFHPLHSSYNPPAAEARMCKKCWRMIVWHLHIWFFMLRHLMESLLNRTSLSVNSLEPFNDALLSQKLWQIPHVTRGPFSRCTWHKHGSSPSLPLLVWRKHVFILGIIS